MSSIRDYINLVTEKSLLAEADAAVWTPTPDQAKWIGGANQQDPYILSRMPGDKPPVTHFTDPKDQALAKQLGFPAAPDSQNPTDPSSAAAVNGSDLQSDQATAAAAAADPTNPSSANAVNGSDLQSDQATAAAAAADPTGQAATPANRDSMPFSAAFADARKKGEATFKWKGKDYTTQMAAKPAQGATPAAPGTDASGRKTAATDPRVVGNSTQSATPAATVPATTTSTSRATPSDTTGLGKKGPTVAAAQGKDPSNPLNQPVFRPGASPAPGTAAAARRAPAETPAPGTAAAVRSGQAATPAANPNVAKLQAEIDRFTQKNNMSYQANKDYVAKLQAQLGKPAATPAAPVTQGATNASRQDMEESSKYDEVERLVSLIHYR